MPTVAKLAIVLVRALLAVVLSVLAGSIQAGTVTEITGFGSNPGNLRMFQYQPETLSSPAPLVVALHGCQQTALEYAQQSGWMQQADRWGFVLLLPEQRLLNNWQRCFNWFLPGSISRDRGETGSIRQMVAHLQTALPIDSQRLYITGLSAGGAMTAALLAHYPEVFAGGAIVAGVPYGCATGWLSAWRCQWWGRDWEPDQWRQRVQQATAEVVPKPTRWPSVSIWQGESDWVVDAANADELLEQWTALHGITQTTAITTTGQGYSHRLYRTADGKPRVEIWRISQMGHGQAVDPGDSPTQCGISAAYFLPVGLCASYHILRFWGLAHSAAQ